MAQERADVVQWNTGLKPPAPSLVSEIVEVKIELPTGRTCSLSIEKSRTPTPSRSGDGYPQSQRRP